MIQLFCSLQRLWVVMNRIICWEHLGKLLHGNNIYIPLVTKNDVIMRVQQKIIKEGDPVWMCLVEKLFSWLLSSVSGHFNNMYWESRLRSDGRYKKYWMSFKNSVGTVERNVSKLYDMQQATSLKVWLHQSMLILFASLPIIYYHCVNPGGILEKIR